MTKDVDVLNDVTKTLIDSRIGYEKMIETVDDNYLHIAEFRRRLNERKQLISEFQQKVSTLGGEPTRSGSVAGALHRNFASFASLFTDNEKAALEAVDDGEGRLAEEIEEKLKTDGLSSDTRDLLTRALSSARAGERFADALD